MKPLYFLVFAAFLPLAAQADPLPPLPAAEADLAAQLYQRRPVVVFADSPEDPAFLRQMQFLARDTGELTERDVILVTDTDPAAKTEWRQKLRPRGFSLVLMDKDLTPIIRKPLPWDLREITRAIDKFPLRRQEMLDQHPGR
ncbi:MAG TPA: methylmalonyl-CoA epimerase [Gemmobacter sp.]|nr:MAG: methylmalonyl-CoA epimerase [Rhodobacteraceae bacterium GWF1_65_7]HBD89510.1 methylmalonyl-CoA epimerase [Gemmobacter sp.]